MSTKHDHLTSVKSSQLVPQPKYHVILLQDYDTFRSVKLPRVLKLRTDGFSRREKTRHPWRRCVPSKLCDPQILHNRTPIRGKDDDNDYNQTKHVEISVIHKPPHRAQLKLIFFHRYPSTSSTRLVASARSSRTSTR